MISSASTVEASRKQIIHLLFQLFQHKSPLRSYFLIPANEKTLSFKSYVYFFKKCYIMMIFDEKMTTPDFHRSTNESITGRSDSIRSQRIDTNPCDGNSADHQKGSSDSSYSSTSAEDTNNMFTKVSLSIRFFCHSL